MGDHDPEVGNRVTLKSHGDEAHGNVVNKGQASRRLKGRTVAPSTDNPECIIETDDGKHAAHKASALKTG